MSRKDTLKAMLSRRTSELPPDNSEVEAVEPATVAHVRSGAVGAMGRSLGQIASAAERAKALVASGAAVVEIPANKLIGSFAQDRLDDEGEDYQILFTAIRDSGQKSPILVRPHPEKADLYQIAYGHRRAKILSRLGRPVRAVVQNLSDEDLVVIQGQENSARKDLTYIERALFALTLEEQGFARPVIMSALSMEKTQLSRLLALAHSVPKDLVFAIGPAPKAGRPRWTALAERISASKNKAKLEKLLSDPKFREADTDLRFARIFNALAPSKTAPAVSRSIVTSQGGLKIAMLERAGDALSVIVAADDHPDFAEFIAARLPELYRQYEEGKDKED